MDEDAYEEDGFESNTGVDLPAISIDSFCHMQFGKF